MSSDPSERPHAFSRLPWDPSLGRYVRKPHQPNVFEPLDTPFRLKRAIGFGRNAALGISALHLVSALLHLWRIWEPRYWHVPGSLLGRHPVPMTMISAAGGLAALYLAQRIRNRRSRVAGAIVVAWSLLLFPVATFLYGFAPFGPLAAVHGVIIVGAILGLRGLMANPDGTTAS
jgi:hypothetical protein